ncbi:hypothetical protein [Cobetia amphilecti]|uniref:hypothetical protein n=1 Tax=Cobetia amphilecti TaxID=1055104 RepID=UPI0024486E53|nr:hypothetical protein [Cobetia litoralis]MDH2420614.1 hypothetical protein [Cobetia litoralis]
MKKRNNVGGYSSLDSKIRELQEISSFMVTVFSLIEEDLTRKACESGAPFLDEESTGNLVGYAGKIAKQVSSLAVDIDEALASRIYSR